MQVSIPGFVIVSLTDETSVQPRLDLLGLQEGDLHQVVVRGPNQALVQGLLGHSQGPQIRHGREDQRWRERL
jgi:hypothetical protein